MHVKWKNSYHAFAKYCNMYLFYLQAVMDKRGKRVIVTPIQYHTTYSEEETSKRRWTSTAPTPPRIWRWSCRKTVEQRQRVFLLLTQIIFICFRIHMRLVFLSSQIIRIQGHRLHAPLWSTVSRCSTIQHRLNLLIIGKFTCFFFCYTNITVRIFSYKC